MPLALEGSVEILPLTEETCSDTFWRVVDCHYHSSKAPLLLANLHGDAMDFESHVKFLAQISSAFIVFMGSTWDKREQDLWDSFRRLVGTKDAFWIMTDTKKDTMVDGEGLYMNTTTIENGDALRILEEYLGRAIKCPPCKVPWQELSLSAPMFMEDHNVHSIKKLVAAIEQDSGLDNGPLNTRSLLNLHTMYHEAQTVKQKRTSLKGIRSKTATDLETTICNTHWQELMQSFIAVLTLPTGQCMVALDHLETELSRISELSNVRNRRKIRELQTEASTADRSQQESEILNKIDQNSIGLEQFFREAAQIHRITKRFFEGEMWSDQLGISCARLLVAGQAIEFVDGDNANFAPWFSAVTRQVDNLCSNAGPDQRSLRVFILSIIGIQSSGKSTLLNALFGCQFPVSAGRCTKGICIRLLFLSTEYRQQLRIDALLLLDTEGLDAPEKIHLKESKQRDRLMTTCIMGISDLTIINTLGDNISEMKDILETAIVSLSTLRVAKFYPEIVLTHCTLTERNEKSQDSTKRCFLAALHDTADFLKEENKKIEFGISIDKSFEKVRATLNNPTLVEIRPYKNGATPNSPPSMGYHEDICTLFRLIEERIIRKDCHPTLSDWEQIVQNIWVALQQKILPISYQNLLAMSAVLRLENNLFSAKQSITQALQFHGNELRAKILRDMQEQKSALEFDSIKEAMHNTIKRQMDDALAFNHVVQCKTCADADRMVQDLKREHLRDGYPIVSRFIKSSKAAMTEMLYEEMEAAIVNTNLSIAMRSHINAAVRDLCRTVKPGTVSNDYVDKVGHNVCDAARSKSKTEPFEQRFEEELYHEYERMMDVISAIVQKNQGNLREAIRDADFAICRSTDWIIQTLDSAVSVAMPNSAKYYIVGMVGNLKQNVIATTEQLSKKLQLHIESRLTEAMHIYAGVALYKKCEAQQLKWEGENSMTGILMAKKSDLRELIKTRIQYGFSFAGDGRAIAKPVFSVVRNNSEKATIASHEEAVSQVLYLQTSQTVRVAFFMFLLETIDVCTISFLIYSLILRRMTASASSPILGSTLKDGFVKKLLLNLTLLPPLPPTSSNNSRK